MARFGAGMRKMNLEKSKGVAQSRGTGEERKEVAKLKERMEGEVRKVGEVDDGREGCVCGGERVMVAVDCIAGGVVRLEVGGTCTPRKISLQGLF